MDLLLRIDNRRMVYTCRAHPPRLLRPLPPPNRYSMCHIVPEHRHLACFQQDKLRTACRHARFGRIWLGLTGLFWVCRCCVAGPRFSTVITSSAGYPLDKTYYQTVKGMVCHSHRPQLPGSPHSLAPVCSAWCVRRSGPGCGACIY
jgi:hypothetical protein